MVNGFVDEVDGGFVDGLVDGVTALSVAARVLARSARVARRVVAAERAEWSWERWD